MKDFFFENNMNFLSYLIFFGSINIFSWLIIFNVYSSVRLHLVFLKPPRLLLILNYFLKQDRKDKISIVSCSTSVQIHNIIVSEYHKIFRPAAISIEY
jgi:hypothetical protein